MSLKRQLVSTPRGIVEYGYAEPMKKRRQGPPARAGYTTVARTKGVYAAGEMKYFDSELASVGLQASATWANTMKDPTVVPVANMNSLFTPTVGAGINQRIGKGAKVFKIKIRGTVHCPKQVNQVANDDSCQIRLLLVQDNQTNSTQMTGAQLMQSPVTAEALLATQVFQNQNNFGRFKVLKDKVLIFQNPSVAFDGTNIEQSGMQRTFKFNITFKEPVNVRFNATNGGTIADIVDHSWHIVANNSSEQLEAYISYNCRVCFKE